MAHNLRKQIKSLRQRVLDTKEVFLKQGHILWAIRSKVSGGDSAIAYELLVALSNASEGILTPFDPNTRLTGAVNRHAVTCYLDSTLFSIFSRLDSFEAMLYNSVEDVQKQKLSFLLRLWVNLLRSGVLITTDITKEIQECLAKCGWEDARELHQQDASEAFTFITEQLNLPLLTLQMSIHHAGKHDSDDKKYVNERLLEVAIPTLENGEYPKEIKLEDCLEEYFNNRIEVKRYLQRRNTLQSTNSIDSKAKEAGISVHVETVELDGDAPTPLTPLSPMPPALPTRPANRHRASSLIQERFVPEKTQLSGSPMDDTRSAIGRLRQGSIRKEVQIPAWQAYSLIPWYTNVAPSTDAQVAAHFSSKRPVLGLCLKRYSFTSAGEAVRLDTYVDIPIEIGLPYFIHDDNMDEDGPLYGNFKLSLQSVVCHRGISVDSGHYVSLVRSTANMKGSEGETSQWLRFDDLAPNRVSSVDIYQALKNETPYLLFYQILPVDGDPGNLTAGEISSPGLETVKEVDTAISSSAPPAIGPIRAVDGTDEQAASSRPTSAASSTETPRGRTPDFDASRRPSAISFVDYLPRSSRKSLELTQEQDAIIEHKKSGSFNNGLTKTWSKLGMRTSRKNSKEDVAVEEKSERSQSGPQIQVERVSTITPPEETIQDRTRNKSEPGLTSTAPPEVGHGAIATDLGRSRSKRDKSRGRRLKVGKGKPDEQDRECTVM